MSKQISRSHLNALDDVESSLRIHYEWSDLVILILVPKTMHKSNKNASFEIHNDFFQKSLP